MKLTLFILLALALTSLPGCYYDNEEELYPNSFCDTTNVTFNASILPLVQARCALPGCHVTGAQAPNLSQPSEVLAIAASGALNTVVLVNKVMPPTGPLPNCDRNKIKNWLDAGAPEN